MARPKTIITKAELAGVLGLSKARISNCASAKTSRATGWQGEPGRGGEVVP